MSTEAKNGLVKHLDVIIVGAGLSGIGAAHHLNEKCPNQEYMIFEGRPRMGGTWDLFQYPGIRSDSDMYTLGYSFRPWTDPKAIADGPSILKYIKDAARDGNIDDKIKYNHKVKSASWSTKDARWTLSIDHTEANEIVQYSCNFLFMCSGYYNVEEGYMPDFPGVDQYKGQLVHPQKWPKDLNYENKKVTVIGSGATAVTLVPEMAKTAAKVTMLQRSPTYIVSKPDEDAFANFMRKIFPPKWAYAITRWKNVLFGIFFYNLARSKPNFMRNLIMKGVKAELGPDYDCEKHFKPSYNPWDQRLCLVPNSDLFNSIKDGSAEVVTDHIETFTENGIQLKSGESIEADIVVSATGLKLVFLGNMQLTVDGKEIHPPDLFCYRGTMYSGIPNLAQAFGYTNASWTLKCDLSCEYVCRILNHMEKTGATIVTPTITDDMEEEPLLDFNSGYVLRSIKEFPRQGSKLPWKLYQNYPKDILNFRYSKLEDNNLVFSN